ncbi:MAG: MarR family transcriptional regulator [Solirubrobacteraceae bacterium]
MIISQTSSDVELPVRLRRVVVRLSRQLRRQSASGLPPALDSALGVIGRRGPLTPSELARLEDVRRPTATRLVAMLECRGLVERAADPCDGRSYRVGVTLAGSTLLGETRTRRDAYLARALAALHDDDRDTLEQALAVLERLVVERR